MEAGALGQFFLRKTQVFSSSPDRGAKTRLNVSRHNVLFLFFLSYKPPQQTLSDKGFCQNIGLILRLVKGCGGLICQGKRVCASDSAHLESVLPGPPEGRTPNKNNVGIRPFRFRRELRA
jgi:hypothetical protein